MSIFNFFKKNNNSCECGCSSEKNNKKSCCSNKSFERISSIKILGSGCKNCHTLFENTQKAIKTLNLNIGIEYITDMQEVMKYGVISTPILVFNEEVVSYGKVLKENDIIKLLKNN